MSDEVTLSLVALVVALFALVVAGAQLLQQLFGTADGLRKCQPSVLGDYASKRRLRWRWSEFRFETRYTTPFLSTSIFNEGFTADEEVIFITGTEESRAKTLVSKKSIYEARGPERLDRVGWLLLLHNLHCIQSYNMYTTGISDPDDALPALQLHERSWDFVTPDVMKPLATSTVGAIIIIAHRLGMQWLDMLPRDGIMRAEGSGESLTAILERGLGLRFRYTSYDKIGLPYDRPSKDSGFHEKFHSKPPPVKALYLPTRHADMLSFGIIPACEGMGIRDFVCVGHNDDDTLRTISQSLQNLGVSLRDASINSPLIAQRERYNNGLGDLPALLSPFIVPPGIPGHVVPQIPNPFRWKLFTPTAWREGRMYFAKRLDSYVKGLKSPSPQLQALLNDVNFIKGNHGMFWNGGMKRSPSLVKDLREVFDRTTSYFNELNSEREFDDAAAYDRRIPSFYNELVATHVSVVAPFGAEAHRRCEAGHQKHNEGWVNKPLSPEMLECSVLYVDSLPEIVNGMQAKDFNDEQMIIDAWWTMMFRGCWWRLSFSMMDPSPVPIPSHLYGSSIPVWIG